MLQAFIHVHVNASWCGTCIINSYYVLSINLYLVDIHALVTNPVRSLYSFFLLLLPMKIKSIKLVCMHVRSCLTTFNKLHTCIATTILCSTHIYTVHRETWMVLTLVNLAKYISGI